MKKRKFTKEDKLQIIKEASEPEVKATLEKQGNQGGSPILLNIASTNPDRKASWKS